MLNLSRKQSGIVPCSVSSVSCVVSISSVISVSSVSRVISISSVVSVKQCQCGQC